LRHNGAPYNGAPYNGVNILLLWGSALESGYASHIWMTYKQAAELGAHVRKDEHGALVVYADRMVRSETNEKGEDVELEIPFMKGHTVLTWSRSMVCRITTAPSPNPRASPRSFWRPPSDSLPQRGQKSVSSNLWSRVRS
jgi:hypothetical protein